MNLSCDEGTYPIRMQMQSSGDGRLLALIAAGDQRAFREMYDRYYKRIYLFSYRMLGEGEGAREVANEVMMEVWKGASKFRGESKPSTWIYGIAVNKIRKEFKRRPRAHGDLESLEKEADGKTTQDNVTYRAELRERMRTAISRLSREHREVLDLTYYQGLSIKEIADIVGCPLNTVKTRMFYARKRLGGILEEMGIGGEV